jgi:N-acetylmuramoyl-L-alanine amidase
MITKRPILLLSIFFTAALATLMSLSSVAQQKATIRTIIVDAGHGGKATGAKGDYSYEKDICLDVALKLGKKLEQEFPEIKILYTRTTDVYTDNRWRADFANSNKGDLFVSIHVNAAPKIRHNKFAGYKNQVYYTGKGKKRKKHSKKVPRYTVYFTDNPSNGTETYIWAADRSDEKESFVGSDMNSPEVEEDSTEYTPDINDPEFKAKALLWTKRFFDKSYMLASFVEDEFIGVGRFSRGVKQRNEKGIWVLQATSMPSILVETGFITYKSDEDYLNSEKGQTEIADNVLAAVKKYKQVTEGKGAPAATSGQ